MIVIHILMDLLCNFTREIFFYRMHATYGKRPCFYFLSLLLSGVIKSRLIQIPHLLEDYLKKNQYGGKSGTTV